MLAPRGPLTRGATRDNQDRCGPGAIRMAQNGLDAVSRHGMVSCVAAGYQANEPDVQVSFLLHASRAVQLPRDLVSRPEILV